MASSTSNDLKLELITTGEKSGTWGTITNSAFSGTVVIGKARILPNGSEVEITIGNVTIRVNRNVLVSGNQINLATDTVDVISWNPIIPGATGVWIPIDPDNP